MGYMRGNNRVRGASMTPVTPMGVYNPQTGRVEKTNYNPYNSYNRATGSWGNTAGQPPPNMGRSTMNQVLGRTGQQGGGGDPRGRDRIEQSRKEIIRMTQGRAQELKQDPRTRAALDFLGGVMRGDTQPFDETTKAAMFSEASDQAASAEGAQQQALREQYLASGGSANDPGFQAAMRRLMAERQGQTQLARRDIDKTAGLANFQSRMSAAPQILSGRAAQNAMINDVLGRAVDFLSADAYSSNIGEGLRAGGATSSGGIGGARGAYAPSVRPSPMGMTGLYDYLQGGGSKATETPRYRNPTTRTGSQSEEQSMWDYISGLM